MKQVHPQCNAEVNTWTLCILHWIVSFICFLFFSEIMYLEVTKMKYCFAAELLFTEATINHII